MSVIQDIKGYEVRDRIGTGGFGAVYRAYQSTIGREVAIKFILPGFANQPDFIRRFESEAQLIARLEHPHIIPLYDYWRDPEGAYLVMRWVRGGSLGDALQNGPFELRAAALLLDQVAGALSLAHRNNVIHRDIKPGNILLDEDSNAYLTDFGIAKDLNLSGNNTQPDAIMGSLDYISPEQARGEPVTARTDIYSLAVTMYEVISGHHPFENISPIERLYKHINDALPEITTLDDSLEAAVNRVIQKATAKDPDQRYPDALAFAADFREAIGFNRAPTDVIELLTQREHDILQLIIEGLSNKEIAQRLTISLSTVKWYVNQIYSKLGVRSRVQAIVQARELKLIGKSAEAPLAASVPTEDFHPQNPYKGLRAFTSADYETFFGREKLVEKLLKRMEQRSMTNTNGEEAQQARFLAVIGPSGSGKSSLVKAGLIPAIWKGALPGSEKWFVVEMMPGSLPLDELEIALTKVAAQHTGGIHEQLERDANGLVRVAQLILPNDGGDLLLVIDQFEELFTLSEDEAARQHFLKLIHNAVTAPRSRVRVVVTLRADFYDRPLQYPEFGDLVRSHLETVLPLTAEELERAISRPAEAVGVSFEAGLVAAIVSDVKYQPGALPLLQYALTELFDQRKGRVLPREAYQAIGGTVGALARRADELYLSLDEAGQETVRQMFLRLVTLGEGAEDTRRRVARSELLAVHSDADLMDDLIDTFASYRLLSLDNDRASRSPTVEVAHEAILREWERLRAWLNESRDEIKLQRQLAAMAGEWHDSREDDSYLARGSRLEQFEKWAGETQLGLTQAERDYLNLSVVAREQEQEAEKQRQARVSALEQRSVRFLRLLVAVLLLAVLGAFGLTGVAVNQSAVANHNAALSQSMALAAAAQSALIQGNTDRAIALAAAANQGSAPPPFAQNMLYDAAYDAGTYRRIPCGRIWCWASAVSPDGKTVLTASDNGLVTLWDIQSGEAVRQYDSGQTDDFVQTLAFLPDGKRFLTGTLNDLAILWDVTTGKEIRRFTSPAGDVNAIAVSPDGRRALLGIEGGEGIIWDIETGEILHRLNHNPNFQVMSAAYSPDGKRVLTGSEDQTVVLWDAETGELIRRFTGHENGVFSVTFSPDGKKILSGSSDNSMILWDVESGAILRRFLGHTNWVFSAKFSADGTKIISGSRDQTLILWDVETGQPLHTYRGEAGATLHVEFVPGDRQVISSHSTGYLRVWDLYDQQIIHQFGDEQSTLQHGETIKPILTSEDVQMTATFGADGDILAVSEDGHWGLSTIGAAGDEVALWDLQSGEMVRRFPGNGGRVSAVAFSSDGQSLVASDWDLGISQWNIQTGERIRRYTYWDAGPVLDVAFSPDGNRLVSGSEDMSMTLWDVQTGRILQHFGPFSDAVNTVTFSPDGQTVLAGFGTQRFGIGDYFDTSLHLFDAATGTEIRRFEGHTGPVTAAVFSPDGKTILSASTDATVRLWDVATGKELQRFNGHSGTVWSVSYSPNELYIASASQDKTVIVWDIATGNLLRQFQLDESVMLGVRFTPDGENLLGVGIDGRMGLWRLSLNGDEVMQWMQANRYVPDLTCDQRELYNVAPLCDAGSA